MILPPVISSLVSFLFLVTESSTAYAPLSAFRRAWTTQPRPFVLKASVISTVVPNPEAIELKESLLESVKNLRTLQERDGDFSIDFGVKGGELNEKSRAPQKVDFYSISKEVGEASDDVLRICDQLSQFSPIEEPTKFLGDKENGSLAPLQGAW
eukprot:CAMPEP_0113313212 /NCGR_PEP_ID=MMETSP0010_2-20120614/9724_1 /TAXON_ID=216773 ORGANISM="Corethron hystrix, Strain 308" /NCGR_SAMPLE_ID=MMETSP0010_2 /ASSEMBLY_ACC=CAM_ASM_000155 /LENGTH=153 /DNA_ID=CAMNT_0000169175 /DNA_START=110 /DNA_END=568 /DNA_ORIENTATION=- /assembly_acc=CAM_ASM_000155